MGRIPIAHRLGGISFLGASHYVRLAHSISFLNLFMIQSFGYSGHMKILENLTTVKVCAIYSYTLIGVILIV